MSWRDVPDKKVFMTNWDNKQRGIGNDGYCIVRRRKNYVSMVFSTV